MIWTTLGHTFLVSASIAWLIRSRLSNTDGTGTGFCAESDGCRRTSNGRARTARLTSGRAVLKAIINAPFLGCLRPSRGRLRHSGGAPPHDWTNRRECLVIAHAVRDA